VELDGAKVMKVSKPGESDRDHKRPRVLVTGGGVRLGATIGTLFAQAGWHLVCQYKGSKAAALTLCDGLRAAGHSAEAVYGDLTSEAGRTAFMAEVLAQGGPLDCLVNNASAFEPDTGAGFDAALARQQLEVNLIAPLSLSRLMAAALPGGGATCNASIIHILDQKVFNLNPDYFSYTVTKLALERAVALQAQALAPSVRVCGVAPGLMFPSGPQTQANFDRASRVNLLHRPTDPADVARTCLFLAQTRSITGCTLPVDSGQHLVPLERDVMFMVDQHPPCKT
jgi:NAD(P)-dependent dehydrogenase (short-subunit alcohol dehydrogenase family)